MDSTNESKADLKVENTPQTEVLEPTLPSITENNSGQYKMEVLEKKLEKIESILTEKLTQVIKDESISYASALKSGASKKHQVTLMKQRNSELLEKKEKDVRACNFVIHGKKLWTTEGDKKYVQNLLKDMSVGAMQAQTVNRIGKNIEKGGAHPLLVKLKTKEDKDKFMANLSQLKGKEEYQGVRITEDYTPAELDMIWGMRDEARQMNKKNTNGSFIWVIRGDPKNRMYLKRVKKTRQ